MEKREAQCRVEAAAGGRLKGPAVTRPFSRVLLPFSFFFPSSTAAAALVGGERGAQQQTILPAVCLPPPVLSSYIFLLLPTKLFLNNSTVHNSSIACFQMPMKILFISSQVTSLTSCLYHLRRPCSILISYCYYFKIKCTFLSMSLVLMVIIVDDGKDKQSRK